MLAACGPGEAPADAATAMPAPVYPEVIDADGTTIPAPVLARGDSVFHGRGVGAICSACHGRQGTGTPLVRALSDNTWAHSDGSLGGIREVTRSGVENALTPMPPMGGAMLSPADLEAVAAYVYWISRRDGQVLRQADAD